MYCWVGYEKVVVLRQLVSTTLITFCFIIARLINMLTTQLLAKGIIICAY